MTIKRIFLVVPFVFIYLICQSLIIVHAYPLITYHGLDKGIEFSEDSNHQANIGNLNEDIYLHLYLGVQPYASYHQEIIDLTNEINPKFTVKVLKSDAEYQRGQHRFLVGPVPLESVMQVGQAFQSFGVDNFPVYLKDNTISLITTDSINFANENIQDEVDLYEDNLFETDDQNDLYQQDELSTIEQNQDSAYQVIDIHEGVEASSGDASTLQQYISNQTSAYIESYTTDWLSQYGTVKVKLDLDKNFRLSSGELAFLYPIAAKSDFNTSSTWFVQTGIVLNDKHQYQNRDIANIGLGYRQHYAHFAYGVNAFYDYDWTESHHRASVGLELSTHYVRLNSNYYFPLSDWKQSSQRFESFGLHTSLLARPAESYDVSLTGYIPSIPWVYLDAKYQQFYGRDVEIGYGQQTYSNPSVLSASVHIQPIPLMTFTATYQDEDGSDDHLRFGMQMNYHLGVPFSKQVDPFAVEASQSLEAALYDLVDRDNQMRLEYREARVITPLKVAFKAQQVDVHSGQVIQLSDWISLLGDLSLIKNAEFTGSAARYVSSDMKTFIAPSYSDAQPAQNKYKLGMTLYLKDGSVIETQSQLHIHVLPDIPQPPPTSVEIEFKQTRVVITEKESVNLSQWLSFSGESSLVKSAEFTGTGARFVSGEKKDTFTAPDFQSGPNANNYTLGLTLTLMNGNLVKTDPILAIEVKAKAEPPQPTIVGELVALPKEIQANNIDTSVLRLSLKDQAGKPVTGKTIIWQAFLNHQLLTSGITLTSLGSPEAGHYVASLAGVVPGVIRVKASLAGENANLSFSETITLRENAAEPSVFHSELTAIPNLIVADGRTPSNLVLTLKDNSGENLVGKRIRFQVVLPSGSPYLGNDVLISPIEQNFNGQYSAKLTSTRAGIFLVKATVAGFPSFIELSNNIVVNPVR